MQLLYDREQVSGARAPKFKLMAKIELDEQERALVAHYRFDKAMLVNEFDPELIRKTAMLAVAAFVIAFMVFTAIIGWKTGLFLALVAAGGGGWYYWDKNREFIFVSDLLKGRHFKCGSIVDLAKKEAYLSNVTMVLRQVMESARHWNGTQSQAIPVLSPEEAKRLIVSIR